MLYTQIPSTTSTTATIFHSHTKIIDTWNAWNVDPRTKVPDVVENGRSSDEKVALLGGGDGLVTEPAVVGIRKLWSLFAASLSWFWILIPRRGRPVKQKALHQLHPMAYLDGLRGYFALVIYTRHFMPAAWRWIPAWIIATPGLQFPFRGGPLALSAFFWISGYVCTFKSVGLMQTKQYDKLFNVLSSALFRRYVRLFVPVLGTTAFTIMLFKLGIVIPTKSKARELTGNPIIAFLSDSLISLDITKPGTRWGADPTAPKIQFLYQFWSIRAEFQSSMILYLFCAGACKMTIGNRKLLIWTCILFFIYWQFLWPALSLLGMWFSERRHERVRRQRESETLPVDMKPVTQVQESNLKRSTSTEQAVDTYQSRLKQNLLRTGSAIWQVVASWASRLEKVQSLPKLQQPALLVMFLFSFVVIFSPMENQTSTDLMPTIFRSITPAHWDKMMKIYLQVCIGLVLMLYPLDLLPILQRPLLTPFSQYLAELSFGIYAMQYTVGWSVHKRLVAMAVGHFGKDEYDFFWPMGPIWLISTIVLLWASELFRRCDLHVVTLCQYLEKRFTES